MCGFLVLGFAYDHYRSTSRYEAPSPLLRTTFSLLHTCRSTTALHVAAGRFRDMSSSVMSFVSHWFYDAISNAAAAQQPISGRCSHEADRRFGPTVHGCRSQFDFTLCFEEWILTIVPSIVFIVLAVARIGVLYPRRAVLRSGWLRIAKLVRPHCCLLLYHMLMVPKGSRRSTDCVTDSHLGGAMRRSWHPYDCLCAGRCDGFHRNSLDLRSQLL